ncbi:hypothetical protein ACO0QE_000836 [Hanseniaspora vineae]
MFRSQILKTLRFKRNAHSNSVELSALLKHMVTQKTPQVIYTYKPSKLVKFGSWSLALTFITYGASFGDWAFLTTQSNLEEPKSTESTITDNESVPESNDGAQQKHPLAMKIENLYDLKINTPQNRYYFANAGIAVLTAIPFLLASAALYFPGRIITKAKFLPLSQQMELTTLYNRKTIVNISKCEIKGKLYTGAGSQLCDDKASFSVFLLNNADVSKKRLSFNWVRNLFILSRSGQFFQNDCRFFDVLFMKKEILEEAAKLNRFKAHAPVTSGKEQASSSGASFSLKPDAIKDGEALKTAVSQVKKHVVPKPIKPLKHNHQKKHNSKKH